MTNGEKYVSAALSHEGVRERSGRNDGEPIETWQKQAEAKFPEDYRPGALRGAPWCGCFTSAMSDQAKVGIPKRLTHPYTGYACQEGDKLGTRVTGTIPPGSIMVKCGVHTGIVVRDRGTVVDTIEGNYGNAVQRGVRRKADWRFYTWPDQAKGGTGSQPQIRMVESYGFDDLSKRPDTYGPWPTALIAKNEAAKFAKGRDLSDRWGPVPVELDKRGSRFAFRVGRPGVPYKDKNGKAVKWRFGGWHDKADRKRVMEQYIKDNPNAKLRTWRKRVPVPR